MDVNELVCFAGNEGPYEDVTVATNILRQTGLLNAI